MCLGHLRRRMRRFTGVSFKNTQARHDNNIHDIRSYMRTNQKLFAASSTWHSIAMHATYTTICFRATPSMHRGIFNECTMASVRYAVHVRHRWLVVRLTLLIMSWKWSAWHSRTLFVITCLSVVVFHWSFTSLTVFCVFLRLSLFRCLLPSFASLVHLSPVERRLLGNQMHLVFTIQVNSYSLST